MLSLGANYIIKYSKGSGPEKTSKEPTTYTCSYNNMLSHFLNGTHTYIRYPHIHTYIHTYIY